LVTDEERTAAGAFQQANSTTRIGDTSFIGALLQRD
jgi:hypothetical protein